jgi:hypothetical protein
VYANFAWAESLLVCVYWITVLLGFRLLMTEEKKPTFFALGVLVGFLYAIHPRAASAVISASITILLLRFLRVSSRRAVAWYGSGLAISLAITFVINLYLQRKLWQGMTRSYGIREDLSGLGTADGLGSAVATAIGQVFYLCAASYLLAFIGFGVVLRSASRIFSLRKQISEQIEQNREVVRAILRNDIGALYCMLTLTIMFFMTVLLHSNGIRADHIIYGRYSEGVVGPVILLGMLRAYEIFHRQGREGQRILWTAGFFLLFLGVALFSLAQEALLVRHTETVSITGIFPFREPTWRIDVWRTLLPVLGMSSVAFACLHWRPCVGLLVFALFFLWAGHLNVRDHLTPAAWEIGQYRRVADWLRHHCQRGTVFFLRSGDWKKDLRRERYQFWLQDRRVIPIGHLNEIRDVQRAFVITEKSDLHKAFPDAKLITREYDGSFGLWVLSRDMQDELQRQNVSFLDPADLELRRAGHLHPNVYKAKISLPSREKFVLPYGFSPHHNIKYWLGIPERAQWWMGMPGIVRLFVTHQGEKDEWPQAVRVGILWFAKGAPGHRLREQRAYFSRPVQPGETREVLFALDPREHDGTPFPPGEYEVHVGLVHEGVTWFYQKGDEVVKLQVVIEE